MKVRPLRQSTVRYVRGSLRAYLEGSQNIAWITSVLIHSGLDLPATYEVLLALNGYGNADRYRAVSDWFVQQPGFALPKLSETAEGAQRSY